jgi:hypothetical protein
VLIYRYRQHLEVLEKRRSLKSSVIWLSKMQTPATIQTATKTLIWLNLRVKLLSSRNSGIYIRPFPRRSMIHSQPAPIELPCGMR